MQSTNFAFVVDSTKDHFTKINICAKTKQNKQINFKREHDPPYGGPLNPLPQCSNQPLTLNTMS